MLYSVAVGKTDKTEDKVLTDCVSGWDIETDKYQNICLSNKYIRQRLRVMDDVEFLFKTDTGYVKTDKVHTIKEGVKYASTVNDIHTLEMVNIEIYPKTLALNLCSDFYDSNIDGRGLYDHVLYLMIYTNGLDLIHYQIERDSSVDIVQTFRKHGEYIGCAIGFDKHDAPKEILKFTVKNLETKRYQSLVIEVSDTDVDPRAAKVVVRSADRPTISIDKLRDLDNKAKERNRYLTFKVSNNKNKFPTSVVIGSDDDLNNLEAMISETGILNNIDTMISLDADPKKNAMGYVDELLEYMNASDERRMIPMNIRKATNIDISEDGEAFHKCIMDNVVKKRVRALTIIGNISLSPKFCRLYRILYLFRYDPEKKTTYCIRSN